MNLKPSHALAMSHLHEGSKCFGLLPIQRGTGNKKEDPVLVILNIVFLWNGRLEKFKLISFMYRRATNKCTSCLVAPTGILRLPMKVKFDIHLLWSFGKMMILAIIARSIFWNSTVTFYGKFQFVIANLMIYF